MPSRSKNVSFLLLFIAFLSWAFAQGPNAIEVEKVVLRRVLDGDTIQVGAAVKAETIRIADIDAPEKGSAFADTARDRLRALLEGATSIHLVPFHRDQYGRTVAQVLINRSERDTVGLDVGAVLVREGLARRYETRRGRYIAEQDNARKAKKGIWSSPSADKSCPVKAHRKKKWYVPRDCKEYFHIKVTSKSYRCFDTVEQALRQGFQRSQRCILR